MQMWVMLVMLLSTASATTQMACYYSGYCYSSSTLACTTDCGIDIFNEKLNTFTKNESCSGSYYATAEYQAEGSRLHSAAQLVLPLEYA